MFSTTLAKVAKKSTPLHQAALYGHADEVKRLIRENRDEFNAMLTTVDGNDNLPLDRAAARGHLAIVEILLHAHQSSPDYAYQVHNKQRYTALLSAVRWSLKVMDGTYNQNKCVGKFNTGYHFVSDYIAIIKLLIEAYPDCVNVCDNKGCNALYYVIYALNDSIKKNHRALKNMALQIAEILIRANIRIDIADLHNPRQLAKYLHLNTYIQNIENKIAAENLTQLTPVLTQVDDTLLKREKSTLETKKEDNENADPVINERKIRKKVMPRRPHLRKNTQIDAQQMLSAILNEFINSKTYKIFSRRHKVNLDECEQALAEFINVHIDQLNKMPEQWRKNVIVNIAKTAITLETIATGFLCCKRIVGYAVFHDFLAHELVNDKYSNEKKRNGLR